MKNTLWISLFLLGLWACSKNSRKIDLIPSSNFEKRIDGEEVVLYTLKNKHGLVAQITNYGGRVVSLWTPDKQGDFEDIVLGFDSIDGYLNANEKYFGALIGRYGNRINKGRFHLNDSTYQLKINNGENHLHGGIKGFESQVWKIVSVSDTTLVLSYVSVDGEENYPGTLETTVTYELTSDNALKVSYKAICDKDTPVNLTHHSFFNLSGAGNQPITNHMLQINASLYTPIDKGLIPTGEIASVKGTPFDFRKPTAIGKRINMSNKQLQNGLGYDHNFVLDKNKKTAAKIVDPVSGRSIEVFTDEIGIQLYTGNFLDGKDIGKQQKPYQFRTAFCLETQHFPDSPNNSNFPSTILKKGKVYTSSCIYKFGIQK